MKSLEPFTKDELTVIEKVINTFSDGGHPAPDADAIPFFNKTFVVSMLEKAETFLSSSENSGLNKELQIVRQLLARSH